MITHLESGISECKVKWAMGNITTNKASGGDGIPAKLFQTLKYDVVRVPHSICQQIWKLSSGHRTGKAQFSFQSHRKAMSKDVQTTAQLHSSHILVKWYSKFSRQGFNSTWTENFQMVKLDLEKAEEPEIKLPTCCIIEKAREFQKKKSTSACLTMYKSMTLWITTDYGKFWKRWEYQTTWPVSWEISMSVKKQQLELVMEQWTGSNLGKEYVKAVYCHPAYFTYMHSTKCLTGWNISWNQDCRGKQQ